MGETIKCGVIGYGKTYNFGNAHGNWITAADGMELSAVCVRSAENQARAKRDFPWIDIYPNVTAMLKSNIDLAVVVTPQNTHFDIVMECLEAGKHVIVEKPMALTAGQTDEMMKKARDTGLMLAVFHNRRYDGNYMTIKEIIEKGIIGDVFHIEVTHAWYGHPGHT
ncbi:MAG TPA: Gfo/Idh/MocA family oxidoreductase, partial [Clostridia bacterium]|nr:Gfo/Idh/MocA family oxidoreductase [Clostridia bacterium]